MTLTFCTHKTSLTSSTNFNIIDYNSFLLVFGLALKHFHNYSKTPKNLDIQTFSVITLRFKHDGFTIE